MELVCAATASHTGALLFVVIMYSDPCRPFDLSLIPIGGLRAHAFCRSVQTENLKNKTNLQCSLYQKEDYCKLAVASYENNVW